MALQELMSKAGLGELGRQGEGKKERPLGQEASSGG